MVWTFQATRSAWITSEASAAALIGPLWIHVVEGSSSSLLTHPEVFQTHRLNPTGSTGSRMRPLQHGGFPGRGSAGSAMSSLPGVSARLPVGIVEDDHTRSRLTCQFASRCVASNEDDGLGSDLHASHVTTPQVTVG